jgi:hypothetical protein
MVSTPFYRVKAACLTSHSWPLHMIRARMIGRLDQLWCLLMNWTRAACPLYPRKQTSSFKCWRDSYLSAIRHSILGSVKLIAEALRRY